MGMYDRVAGSGVWVTGWIGLVEWSLRLGLPFQRERSDGGPVYNYARLLSMARLALL